MNEQATGSKTPLPDDHYRLLVGSITDYAIYMLDPGGIVSNWNAGAQRFKGYRAEEIIGEHFSRFYTDEDRATNLPARALDTAATQGKFEAEGWRVRKDGTRFWAHVVIDPIRADDGSILGYAKITRDLTERYEAQRALELAREALFQSQKMDAIGQLTGGVAHDFNNLLMAVLGSLELLRKRVPLDAQAEKLLNNAVEGAQRGATLTQRMLAFARRQDLNAERVELPRMVLGMADLLQRSLGPAWSIETRFPLGVRAVRADVNQLEMALLNLVVNARDAMPDGGTVTIATREHRVADGEIVGLAGGHYVSLCVTDTGTGMDAATLARAMEPFFTTKGVGKGTGLGLSMIHGFAEQLGGTFMLKSKSGEGTTAELWLPVTAAEATPAAEDTLVLPPEKSRPLTILAVDDDAIILMNTAAMLEDMGHKVFEADGAGEALDTFRAQPGIDLIITDYAMPGRTGVQLAAELCAERPGLPVILATGYGEMSYDPSLRMKRLSKPFSEADLRKVIAEAITTMSQAV